MAAEEKVFAPDDPKNPAYVQLEPEPERVEYVVVGETEVYGCRTGERFSAVPDEGILLLLQGGHIEMTITAAPDAVTVEELNEQAKELGIEGYSKLKKDALAHAVSEALEARAAAQLAEQDPNPLTRQLEQDQQTQQTQQTQSDQE